MRAVVVTVVASFLLAGCAGSSDGGSEATEGAIDAAEDAATSGARGLVWSDGEPVLAELHEEGTFAATDYCIGPNFPSCFLDGSSGGVSIDITDVLPVGMPSRVTVVHEYESSAIALHDIGFNNGCGGYWFASEGRATAGPHVMGSDRIEFEILMAPCFEDATTQVNIFPIVSDPQPETAWTLDVTVEAEPDRALPGLPVVVPVGGNVTGFEASTESGEGAFLLWGGDDTFLGRHSTTSGTATFPADGNATAGEYVLVVAADSPPLQINLTGATQEQEFQGLGAFDWRPAGSVQALTGPGPATWDFDVDATALGVVLVLEQQSAELPVVGLRPAAHTNIDATVSSPAGAVLETSFECMACLPIFSGSMDAVSEPGHAAMEAGTFTATVDYDHAAGVEAQAYTFHYQRP